MTTPQEVREQAAKVAEDNVTGGASYDLACKHIASCIRAIPIPGEPVGMEELTAVSYDRGREEGARLALKAVQNTADKLVEQLGGKKVCDGICMLADEVDALSIEEILKGSK